MELFIKSKIKQELKKLNISYSNIDLIHNKDGVIVARVQSDVKSYIIKYFQNEDFKREIKNYQILNSLNIPTVKVFGFTDSAILMEDISQSDTFRLATKEELDDVASVLVTLYHACQRKNFPSWVDSTLNELKTDYENKVQTLLNS